MPFWDPPHDKVHVAHDFEPFLAALIEFLVHGSPNEFLQAFDICPDGQIGDKLRVAINAGFRIAGAGFA